MGIKIQNYVNAVADYYRAVWAAVPAGTDEERRAHFNAINNYVMGLPDNTAAPTQLPAGVRGHITDDDLENLTSLIDLRGQLGSLEVPISEDLETRTAVAGFIQRELRARMLNTTDRDPNTPGDLGVIQPADISVTNGLADNVWLGTEPHLTEERTAEAERAEAIDILTRYVRTIVTENPTSGAEATPAQTLLRTALGIDLATLREEAAAKAYVERNFSNVLTAFQNSREPAIESTDGRLNPATVRALKSARGDRALEARAFGEWASNASQDAMNFLRGVPDQVSGALNSAGEAADNARDAVADAVDGHPSNETGSGQENGQGRDFGQMLQGWFGGLGDMFQNTSMGGWLGGVVGAAIAWFASNMFGAGPFRMIMMVLMVPMMFILGRNMGQNWNIGGGNNHGHDGQSPQLNGGPGPYIAQSGPSFAEIVNGANLSATPSLTASNATLPDEAPVINLAAVTQTQAPAVATTR